MEIIEDAPTLTPVINPLHDLSIRSPLTPERGTYLFIPSQGARTVDVLASKQHMLGSQIQIYRESKEMLVLKTRVCVCVCVIHGTCEICPLPHTETILLLMFIHSAPER